MLKYCSLALAVAALSVSVACAKGVDPLEAKVIADDADRFAALFEKTGGAPTAEELQRDYLDPGSRGVEIFTPNRIQDAENLAAKIAANKAEYQRGIDVCLPIAKASSGELRAVYLALDSLLDHPDLPKLYVLFGAGNSGGTAGPDAQVLGLEVICRVAQSEEEIKTTLRRFYAHETIHTLQDYPSDAVAEKDPLLTDAMVEGVADFMAWMATGAVPDPARAEWAEPREAEIWAEFSKDRIAVKALSGDDRRAKESPYRRWLINAGSAPEGWPSELGYWVGMRICQAYFDGAKDKRQAIKDLMALKDPLEILEKSGYAKRFEHEQ